MAWTKKPRRGTTYAPAEHRPRKHWPCPGWLLWALTVGAAWAVGMTSLSSVHAQNVISTESSVSRHGIVQVAWTGNQFVVAGLDARDGRTKWILPRNVDRSAQLGSQDLSSMSVDDLLQAGYWVQSASIGCQGEEAILVLRQP